MRAKSDIIAYLASQLTDDIWKKLQNSLLGRELIAFGAEVISENENVKDTMLLQMNPETADKNGLYMLSQMNEIPITNIKPSSVVVQMENYVKTYAPYELEYSIGNVHFTNIEYTMQGKSVSLINGTHKCWAVGMERSANSVEGGSETFFYDGTTTYSGIKLGNAYPDSIVVEYEHIVGDVSVVTEMNRYSSDIALSDNVDMMYKVTTGVDGSIYIRFLNGGDTIPNPTTYKIDWLDHSAMEFEIQSNDVMDGNNKVATVQYSSQGVEDDLEFMRQQLKKEMAKYNGLNTPKSVEDYVEGMPYIIDSKCVAEDNGTMCVYVKPSSDSATTMYLDFSEIAAHISLNSIMFPNLKIKVGRKLDFGVTLGGITEASIQNSVRGLIQDLYAYDKMGFDSTVNVSQILSEVYSRYGIVPSITMNIREPYRNNEPLCYVPVKNTLKGYDSNDVMVMSEINGVLYGKKAGESLMSGFDVVGCIGTMMLLKKKFFNPTIGEVEWGYSGKDVQWFNTNFGISIENFNSQWYNEYQTVYKTTDENNVDKYYLKNNHAKKYYFKYYKNRNNRFYLYDLSSNLMKPYDDSLNSMLSKDANPCLLQESWGNNLSNLLDVELLSVNNSVVLNFIFKSNGLNETYLVGDNNKVDETKYKVLAKQVNTISGTEVSYTYNTIWYQYWNPKHDETDNEEDFDYFLNNTNETKETNNNYKGCFQTAICISDTNDFRNLMIESLNVKDVCNGNDNKVKGFYGGFKGIKNGVNLNVKSNAFYCENNLYYLSEINDDYVVLRNNTTGQEITISIQGVFKGMIEQSGVLYVIFDQYVAVVEGFSGIKQRTVICNICKDSGEPLMIDEIVNGLDNGILFKSNSKFYYATGIEASGSVATFKNLKELNIDDSINDGTLQMGSCTSEYATFYKINESTVEYLTTNNRMDFYCYDIKQDDIKNYYCKYSITDYGESIDVTTTDTNVSGESQVVGFMDYGNNKIENTVGLGMNTIRYEGLSAYNTKDTYLVLNENEINFTNQ